MFTQGGTRKDEANPTNRDGILKNPARARWMVLGSVLSATLFILPFKKAAEGGRGAGAALGLLCFVAILFGPWALMRRLPREVRAGSLSLAWKIALFAALGNVAQGFAFERLHPGVAATFIQMNVLFVLVFGALWLREPLRLGVALGVLLALAGVAVAQAPALVGHVSLSPGVLWSVLAALGFSLIDVFSRRQARDVDPLLTNVLRALGAAALLAFVPGAVRQLLDMSRGQLAACAAAALLGPGIGRYLLLHAARELPAVESALLQQLRPLLALPLASLAFHQWPSEWEWAGCALVVLGVLAPYLIARRNAVRISGR
jgi:drug/metabolite transporter (DMT)-like permease